MKNITKILSLKTWLLLFLFLPILATSQQNSSIDIVLGSDFTYRILIGESSTSSKSLRNERESGLINFKYGVDYNLQFRKNLIFKTGIRIAKIGYNNNYSYTSFVFLEPLTTEELLAILNGEEIPPSQPNNNHKVNIKTNHQFIELPVALRYLFNKKKLSPFVEFGLSPYLYVNTHTKGSVNEDTIDSNRRIENKDFRKVNLMLMVSFGVEYKVVNNLKIFFQPNYRLSLLKKSKNGPIKEYPYSLGLEFGIRKYLN
ncbi:MAG: hypothetical protein ACI8VT_004115 [Saprospiraceae bacterium]|jgi:hypothetical protein